MIPTRTLGGPAKVAAALSAMLLMASRVSPRRHRDRCGQRCGAGRREPPEWHCRLAGGPRPRVIAMRAGVARSLTPIVSWSGEEREVSDSTCPALARFHDPAYPLAAVWSGTFFELVPFRIDVACEAGSEGCLRIVSPDTIGGLARIRVSAEPQTIETAGSVELFERPGSANPVRAVVGPATKVEILEGAARVFWTRNRGSTYLEARDEWLRVRLDGRVGWMHAKFEAIGLPSAG